MVVRIWVQQRELLVIAHFKDRNMSGTGHEVEQSVANVRS